MWGEVRGARSAEAHIQTLDIPERFFGDPAYRHLPALAIQRLGGAVDLRFVDAIVNDRPMSPSFLDGLRVQNVSAGGDRRGDPLERRWNLGGGRSAGLKRDGDCSDGVPSHRQT